MAAESNSVWAVEIGNSMLKALHLVKDGDGVRVVGFDSIRHGKVLVGSGIKDLEREEIIALSLRQFVQQNNIGKDSVVISIPSQNSFSRFVNLPPVEKKRVPEIVKFEAGQQIPFDIDEVEWDWQMMSSEEATEMRVGIFAIKNEIVTAALEYFSRENIRVSHVQMSPMALYNYALYDMPEINKSDKKAIVIVDVGTDNTDIVVCTRSTVWQRSIPMGGNAFTKAVADTFKLNFEKAEKLKRTATMSKYARQVFQAMRPVFTDLASEIQRSLGFYTNSNPGMKLTKVVALGGGTKLRGLLKYLQQTLQIPVEKPDSFNRLVLSSDLSAAKFHENVCDFGVVYGLALQGIGQGRIESNLLPSGIARSMLWASKAKYFTIAACMVLFVSLLCFVRINFERVSYKNNYRVRQSISNVLKNAREADNKLAKETARTGSSNAVIQEALKPFENREIVPLLYQTLISILPNESTYPDQKYLYRSFLAGDVEAVLAVPRKERKQLFVTNMLAYYTDDVSKAEFGGRSLFVRSARKINQDQEEDEGEGGDVGMGGGSSFRRSKTQRKGDLEDTSENLKGFVVTIAGYCPYREIGELIDPAGVENTPDKWGLVTRLAHFDDVVDGNSPFELFGKTEIKNFKFESGPVALGTAMPPGVGLIKVMGRSGSTIEDRVLVDPMTDEVISKVAVFNEHGIEKVDRIGNVIYEINDYWFRLDFKLIWKGSTIPEPEEEG